MIRIGLRVFKGWGYTELYYTYYQGTRRINIAKLTVVQALRTGFEAWARVVC